MHIHNFQPLHLYRAILRETTYLFDPTARTWSQKYIKAAFRKNATKVQDGNGLKTVSYETSRFPTQNERRLLKRGRKFLLLVQRANQGYQRHLRNLLQLSYGRKGREKRAATGPLMRSGLQVAPDSPHKAESLPTIKPSEDGEVTRFTKDWKPPSGFLTLLHAQGQLSTYLNVRKQIKLKSPVPAKNSWGGPMHPSRIKNINKKWYAKLAGTLMPPISEQDWQRLKSIALKQHEFKIISRRPIAKRIVEDEQIEERDRIANTLLSGHESVSRMTTKSIRTPHKLTPRFLGRFYGKHILNHSPVVAPNPNGNGLVSKWDDGKRYVVAAEMPKDSAQVEMLFG